MFVNKIKELRQAKGLTQRDLAKAAKTSQQQIQRIEAGNQHARFDLATKISAALGEPISKVFPSTTLPLARMKKRGGKLSEVYRDEKASDELEEAGIDMEPAVWTLKYSLRGGANGHFPISGPDMHRLSSILQREERGEDDDFVVLPSADRQYALNLQHLVFCHFLFDPVSHELVSAEEKDQSPEVEFYLADRSEPLRFDVDPDTGSIDDDYAEGLSVQLQDLFYYAELGTNGRRLKFVDVDGETAFFRPRDVAMFSVPLWLIEPSASDEEENEETETAVEHRCPEPRPNGCESEDYLQQLKGWDDTEKT
jgi:transcriptional regulator with XRE-family HTH domain